MIGHQSKGNPLATSKNIDVVNPAVNVNSSTRIFVHDSSGFRPRDFTVHGNPVTMLSSRVDDNSGLLVNIGVSGKRLRERKVECYHIGLNTHVSRWSLPGILNHQKDGRLIAGKIDRGLILFSPDAQISPQLPSAGCLRVSDKHLSGKPEQERYGKEQPIPELNSQYRDLRSGIASMFVLYIASEVFQLGWSVCGTLLAAYALFGLLLKIDLWSLILKL